MASPEPAHLDDHRRPPGPRRSRPPGVAPNGGRQARNDLIEAHLGLAYVIARRYRNRGVADDDLNQVALLALVQAAARFDPGHGVPFTAFAGRTIEGEIKRHFRDRAWSVRVPRATKELCQRTWPVYDELYNARGSRPTDAELAARLGVSPEAAAAANRATMAYQTDPLETDGNDHRPDPADDPFETATDTVLAGQLLGQLPPLEQRVVCLRFLADLTQTEIASRLGTNQVQVSRLLQRSLTHLRKLADGRPVASTAPTASNHTAISAAEPRHGRQAAP